MHWIFKIFVYVVAVQSLSRVHLWDVQHVRLSCPSPSPGVCPNLCPLSRWCHPTISSSVVHFSSCLQSFPASGYFVMSQLFTSGGQSVGASASALPMSIQDWFPLGLTGLISYLVSTCQPLYHCLISCAISTYSAAWSEPVSQLISTCQPDDQHL